MCIFIESGYILSYVIHVTSPRCFQTATKFGSAVRAALKMTRSNLYLFCLCSLPLDNMKHKVLRTKNRTISISDRPYVGICMRHEVMCDL